MFRFILLTIIFFPFAILKVINADTNLRSLDDSSMDSKPVNFTIVEEQCNSTYMINPGNFV